MDMPVRERSCAFAGSPVVGGVEVEVEGLEASSWGIGGGGGIVVRGFGWSVDALASVMMGISKGGWWYREKSGIKKYWQQQARL